MGSVFTCSCTAPFGPGYTIDKQDINVHFDPGPPPHISIESNYQLTNTGTQPLSVLELRLPGRRRFRSTNVNLSWDGQVLTGDQSPANARNTLLTLPRAWPVSGRHTLHITIDFQTPAQGDSYLGFAPDAFFLPAQGWSPELLPARGIFATGGVPPKKWNLSVHVPQGFAVHTSGDKIKTRKRGEELTVRATQRPVDVYPYVVAGRYVSKQIGPEHQKIYLWTRKAQDPGSIRAVSDALVKTLQTYNSVFGDRAGEGGSSGYFGKRGASHANVERPFWIVECPVIPGCFPDQNATNARLFGEDTETKSGEMVSLDSAMIDTRPGVTKTVTAAAPALAASWLGYAQSPGFYEQDPPLSAFPAFATAVGGEALNGPAARAETIRRALAAVPKDYATLKEDDKVVLRVKSFLFFYGLQDRYGHEVFRNAVKHMLYARRSGGFDLDDLISAFDQESHRNTAEFVRLWMKHPGVPADFRARYEDAPADKTISSKETTP